MFVVSVSLIVGVVMAAAAPPLRERYTVKEARPVSRLLRSVASTATK